MLVVSKLPELQRELSLPLRLTCARRAGCDLHSDLRTPQAAEGPAPLPAGLPQHELCTLSGRDGAWKRTSTLLLNNLNIKWAPAL